MAGLALAGLLVYGLLAALHAWDSAWMAEDQDGDGVALLDDPDPDGDHLGVVEDRDADGGWLAEATSDSG